MNIMGRWSLTVCLVLGVGWAVSEGWADPANPQPADGDFVLPMPQGLQMVFRPVFIGEGDAPFALRKFKVGDPSGGFRENVTNVVIGGAFTRKHKERQDWLYYLGKYEVTEAQYDAVMKPHDASRRGSPYPVRNISWFDAQRFIHQYNLWLFEHAKNDLPTQAGAVGYTRLPTEIEWEFAARGGAEVAPERFDARYPYTNNLSKHEWFSGPASSHDKVQKIGLLVPNPLHLHDVLGNVSEMTASFYQIEYYQGRVGGFVARGGNFTTAQGKVRASLRSEQPFYRRDLKPQQSPSLGLRLALSSIIFVNRNISRELQAAWPDYRAGGVGATGPAAQSVAPPSTQTNVQLAAAREIVTRLRQAPGLSASTKRDVELLQASFGNIEATIRQAEVDSAFAWIEIATARALFVFRALKQLPASQKTLELAKQVGGTQVREKLYKRHEALLRDIQEGLRSYTASLEQLDRNAKDSVERAVSKYRHALVGRHDADRLQMLQRAVTQHFAQYTQTKRMNLEQLRADFERL